MDCQDPALYIHHYEIIVCDRLNQPIEGARVVCKIKSFTTVVKDTTLITPSIGRLLISGAPLSDPSIPYVPVYKSELEYTVHKDGYSINKGSALSFESYNSTGDDLRSEKVFVVLQTLPIHEYHITVVDISGSPINGAKVTCKFKSFSNFEKDTTLLTPFTGKLLVSGAPLSDPLFTYKPFYKSELEYTISKNGYSTIGGTAKIIGDNINSEEVKVVLMPLQMHEYKLTVEDISGNPIQGAIVHYTLKNLKKIDRDTIVTTPSSGTILATLNASANPEYTYSAIYETEFQYEASKDGYYLKTGTLRSASTMSSTVTLYKPTDYFNPKFLTGQKAKTLKAKVLSFIDYLLLQSLLTDSFLEIQSIGLIRFKEKDYLTFKFSNTNVYNSLKLDKYDIAKILFDDVVRRILDPLNENLGGTSNFYGFDLTIIGNTKNFADDYFNAQKVVYRFLIPKQTVERYKNKDISGQRVLDESFILMDDERIELKLQ